MLAFPRLAFALSDAERRFLDPRWADAKAKNVSVRWPSGELRGAVGTAGDLQELRALIVRFAEQSEALALRLFPHYRGHLRRGNTSFRPTDVAGRVRSWRQDDTRLHVDAFPSNPMQGTRLLRVFCNVNPQGAPRRWRVGEPFEAHARRYFASIRPALPGSAWLMAKTGITKRRRTEYDHLMLQLHDRAKADARIPAHEPAGARRLRARHDLGLLQRPGPARGDGRPAHARADLPARRAAPRPPGERAARDPRAAGRSTAAVLMPDDPHAGDASAAAGAWRRGARLVRGWRRACTPFDRVWSRISPATTGAASLPTCGAGITVGIVALPLAMAFAIASGVKPEQGLFTAIIAGFLISALGGSSVQIGGPAGAFIVIVYGIVQRYGVANLLIATVLAGVLLLAPRLAQARRARPLHPGLDRHRLHQRHRRADRASRRSRTCSACTSTRCRPISSPRRRPSPPTWATSTPPRSPSARRASPACCSGRASPRSRRRH